MALDSFNKFIIDHDIIGFFDTAITLKSGRSSHFYVNWRDATNDAFLLDQLTDYVTDFLQHLPTPFDSLYGVPEGATKTTVITAMKLARASQHFEKGSHTICMGRAAPKPHGDPKDRFFIGAPHGRTLVLEDTTTTGGSLFKAIDHLLDQGVEVVAAVGLTDRMERRTEDGKSVAEAMLHNYGGKITYYSLSNALELIPLAAAKVKPSAAVIYGLSQEFDRYGVLPIKVFGETK